MEVKYKTLSFAQGLRNAPSSVSCADDQLSVSHNIIYKDGEHHIIQQPVEAGDTAVSVTNNGTTTVSVADLVFIHDYAAYTHTILLKSSSLYWKDYNAAQPVATAIPSFTFSNGETIKKVTAIGNTVIVLTSHHIHYFLWDSGDYKYLGTKLPELKVEARLRESTEVSQIDIADFVTYGPSEGLKVNNGDEEDVKNAIYGLLAETRSKVRKNNGFMFPFWLRVGVRMYDETIVDLTNPIVLYPSVRVNQWLRVAQSYSHLYLTHEAVFSRMSVKITNRNAFEDWKDIVDGFVIYVSDDAITYPLDDEWTPINNNAETRAGLLVNDMVSATGANSNMTYKTVYANKYDDGQVSDYGCFTPQNPLTDKQIIKALIDKSQFYEIADIDIEEVVNNTWIQMEDIMEHHALVNLTARTQLPHDDFFDHCLLTASTMMAYNGRLQLGDLTRTFFNGFDYFSNFKPTQNSSTAQATDIFVTIKVPDGNGNRVVKLTTTYDEYLWHWFYYPDPRAKEVIFKNGSTYTRFPLKEHPHLNGAYHFGNLPGDASPESGTSVSAPTIATTPESLPSTVATSEVDNPFAFFSEGYNNIGSSQVLAISTTTDALSEGQFGQFPLIAFTKEGVWAMSLRSDGLYDNMDPISREVAINPENVTQTDNAIFFTSAKGLMVVTGRKVTSISDVLMGKEDNLTAMMTVPSILGMSYEDFLLSCRIAYDYRASLLVFYIPDREDVPCLVYNIKDAAFATMDNPGGIVTHQVLYPDTILQAQDGTLLSFANKPSVNTDERDYDATLLSRPVKCKDLIHYKAVWQLENHADISPVASTSSQSQESQSQESQSQESQSQESQSQESQSSSVLSSPLASSTKISLRIFGSDDAHQWLEVYGMHGMGYKYLRFKVTLSDVKASDIYAGLTFAYVIKQTRRMHPETYLPVEEYTQNSPTYQNEVQPSNFNAQP